MHRLFAALLVGALACSTTGGAHRSGAPGGPGTWPAGGAPPPPPPAARYVTDPGTDGIVGGPVADEIGREVLAALQARGARAQADSTLAVLAAWYYQQVAAGRSPASPDAEQAGARLGFLGIVPAASIFPVEAATGAAAPSAPWREVLAQLARNMPVNRFAVWISPDGHTAVVLFAAVELSLDSFPRRLARNGTLRLRGRIAERFVRGEVYLTPPVGPVRQISITGRGLDVSLPLAAAGRYRVEVMGDGPSGPVVLANVPVYVDVAEPETYGPRDLAPAAGRVEAVDRMLTLLNEARRTAGVPMVVADPELAAVALAYSREMVAGHFFGHVSPVTGTVVDRVRRAGIGVSAVGENVTEGESAEAAHQALMDSPGHRANMLDPRFTHVGIGVAPTDADPPLMATIVFARRPSPERLTARAVLAEIAALRRARRVSVAAIDPVLQAAAEAGMKTASAGGGGAPPKERAMEGAEVALTREDKRLGIRRSGGCAEWLEILELEDLRQVPLLVSPSVKKLGLAVALRATGQPPPLAVLLLVEGAGCQ